MHLYQHDGPSRFRFVLNGELSGMRVTELEHAWTTAASTLGNRDLIVDVSGLRSVDHSGQRLLSRMREAGARLITASQTERRARSLAGGIRLLAGKILRRKRIS